MGWLVLLVLILASAAGLWAMRVRQGFMTAAIAALMLGGSGYALQGRPDLPGSREPTRGQPVVQSLAAMRHAFFGNFTAEESWLRISEALAGTGNTKDAVGVLQNAVRRYPTDAQLWIGLGNALVDHAQGLTPPAQYAYRRAAELMPGHPAPRFFHDLALARSGQGQLAAADLRDLIEEHPDASWRPLVEQLLLAIASDSPASPANPAP